MAFSIKLSKKKKWNTPEAAPPKQYDEYNRRRPSSRGSRSGQNCRSSGRIEKAPKKSRSKEKDHSQCQYDVAASIELSPLTGKDSAHSNS